MELEEISTLADTSSFLKKQEVRARLARAKSFMYWFFHSQFHHHPQAQVSFNELFGISSATLEGSVVDLMKFLTLVLIPYNSSEYVINQQHWTIGLNVSEEECLYRLLANLKMLLLYLDFKYSD